MGHFMEFIGTDAVVGHLEVGDAAFFLQFFQGVEEVFRFGRIRTPHMAGQDDEAVVTDVDVDHVREISQADHDQAGAVGQGLVIGAEGMFQRVFAHVGAEAHFQAAEIVAESHAFPSLHVDAILDGCRQVGADLGDDFQGDHFAHEIGLIGQIAFDIVEQGIETLVGRELRWYRRHEFRVDDGQDREQGWSFDGRLFIRVFIGDNAAGIGFRAGPGRRRNGDDRQGLDGNGFALARALGDVVPQIAVIGGDDGNPLGCIDAAAAA